ncbi:hypothetical protein JAAARDRAFT_34207 [Jaapia argillacea MUCL 33604]|uniref:Reverse transcriptase domain-containing protein n=1 Tax=Jaapia argillacea MUCL 33604 TaxID=933084 RepID=A0A067PX54_9AGAM|nr:hypothetical protein JAAARDRAFT_34207 [Jaapia argillacea MUCL 33604]
MHDFGQSFRDPRIACQNIPLLLFKDDVSSAFLNLPVHPLRQLRQIVCVDGHFYTVGRLVFGNRASPRLWCAV